MWSLIFFLLKHLFFDLKNIYYCTAAFLKVFFKIYWCGIETWQVGRNKREEILSFLCPSLLIHLFNVHTLKTKHDTFKCKLYLELGLDNNSISIYIYILQYILFNNGNMIFKQIYNISIYIASVSYRLHLIICSGWLHWINMSTTRFKIKTLCMCFIRMYVWREPTVFRKVSYFNFIWLQHELLCVQPLPGKLLFLPLQKRLLLVDNDFVTSYFLPWLKHFS